MAKDTKEVRSKFTVDLPDYQNHPAVTTEGTAEEAIKAFQAKHGLDGLNMKWRVVEETVAKPAPAAPATK
jgi:hypothetical protein